MKSFSYTARNATGLQVRGTLDVASREAALRELRRMGLVPSQVDEASAKQADARSAPTIPSALTVGADLASARDGAMRAARGVVLGLVVLVLAGAAWWWVGRKPPSAKTATIPVREETQPAPLLTSSSKPLPASRAMAGQPAATPSDPSEMPAETVPPNRLPTAAIEETKKEEVKDEADFTTITEINLSQLLATPPGIVPIDMSMPEFDEQDAAANEADAKRALANVIVIKEHDDEETAAHKENVGWAKADMAEAMKAGYKASEYSKALYAQLKAETTERKDFLEALVNIAKTEDEETTLAALEKVNAYLKENNRPLIDKSEIIEEEEEK